MILDKEVLFSDAQAIASTGNSENVIDLGAPGTTWRGDQLTRDIGPGVPMEILVQLVADAAGTSPTLAVTLHQSANEDMSSSTQVASLGSIASGSAGDRVSTRFVPDGTFGRYLRLTYTIGGTGTPTHTITAGIVAGVQTNR